MFGTRRIALLHTPWFVVSSFALIFLLNALLDRSAATEVLGDTLGCLYFALYGLYCTQNYLGCREYHCMITGPGFLLAALLMLLRITSVLDLGYGVPYLVFVLAVIVGHNLEWSYHRRSGSRFRTRSESKSER